jgi:hypothetical protein
MPELVLSDVSRRWQVFCGPCGSSSGSCRTPAEAAAHWNSRHAEGPEIGSSSAARTTLALWLSNTLKDLSYGDEPPVYGFRTPERQARAYEMAALIIQHVNHRLRGGDQAEQPHV